MVLDRFCFFLPGDGVVLHGSSFLFSVALLVL